MTYVEVGGRAFQVKGDVDAIRERLSSLTERRLGFIELSLEDGDRLLVRPAAVDAIWEVTWETN